MTGTDGITNVASYIGLIGCGVVYLSAVLRWSWSRNRPVVWRWGVLVIGLVVLVAPLAHAPLVVLLRGFSGDLSIGTLLLCVISLYSILVGSVGERVERQRDRRFMLSAVLIVASVLYPLALGWGTVDPYSWGFGNVGLAVGLFVLCLVAWAFKYYITVIWLLLTVVAYQLRTYESHNLWDYLLDPFLAVYAIAFFISQLFSKIQNLNQKPVVAVVEGEK